MVVLFLLGVDAVEESLMGLSVTRIILLLIKVDFYRERGLWKMFGYEACVNTRP